MLKELTLTIALLSLTACQTTQSKTTTLVAAQASAELAAVEPKSIDARFDEFINIRNHNSRGETKLYSFAVKVCNAVTPGTTNMREIISKFGLPDAWKNNGGVIESAVWPVNLGGQKSSLAIFYTRDGRIRNVAGFRNGKVVLGVSKNTPEHIKCTLHS